MRFVCGDWQYARQMQIAINLLLIILIARPLAGLTWKLITPPVGEDQALTDTVATGLPASNAGQNLLPASGEYHIFGRAEKTVTTVPDTTIAPETTMNLELKGVIASNPLQKALAVISTKGRNDEDVYGVGERLPGNAVIKEIYPDRVILLRAGSLETLPLKEDEAAIKRTLGKAADGQADWRLGRSYLRERMADIPELTKEIGVEFHTRDNEIRGYRLVSAGGSKLLNDFGMQSGDVISSVNGISLINVENGLKAFREIERQSEIVVEFERNGKKMTRTYAVDE